MDYLELPRELTVAEAAAFLRVSKATVRISIAKGTIPVRWRGRRQMVPSAALLRLLRQSA